MKIAIQSGEGIFDLSPIAIQMYCRMKRMDVYFYRLAGSKTGSDVFERVYDETPTFLKYEAFLCLKKDFGSRFEDAFNSHEFSPEKYYSYVFETMYIPRTDEDLIAVIENLKGESSGDGANLKVVEIPEGVDWEIVQDFESGSEMIVEKYRHWS